jgi:hypothetical protein
MADIVSRPYKPGACCESCVFGRGEHAEWCAKSTKKEPPVFDSDEFHAYVRRCLRIAETCK